MHLTIQPGDDVPIYRQIVRQIQQAVAAGRLRAGERVPSQRELGARLVVSPLTVKKAYDELEREGVLETRRGQGTFVANAAGQASSGGKRARLGALSPVVRRLLGEAWAAGIPLEQVLELVRREAERLGAERARHSMTGKP